MTIPKKYTVKFSAVGGKGKVPPESWEAFKFTIVYLAYKCNLDFNEENDSRDFYISTNFENRNKASNVLEQAYRTLATFEIPVQKVRINVAENNYVLEDLIDQVEMVPGDINVDDFYIYYLTPHDACEMRQGKITNNLELSRHRKYVGTKNYGTPVNIKKAIPEVRDLISKLKSEERLGLVTSIEMLRNCERIVYFGPFTGFHGNYKTQLSMQIRYERIDNAITIDSKLEKPIQQLLII